MKINDSCRTNGFQKNQDFAECPLYLGISKCRCRVVCLLPNFMPIADFYADCQVFYSAFRKQHYHTTNDTHTHTIFYTIITFQTIYNGAAGIPKLAFFHR